MEMVFLITVIFFVGVIEAALGNLNIVLPVLPFVGFYFCAVAGWRKTALPLLAMSALLDAIWLRTIPAESLIAILLMFGAEQWREWGDMFSGLALALAGFSAGFISILAFLLNSYFSADGVSISYARRLVFWLILSPVILPIACKMIHRLASFFELTGMQCEHASIMRRGNGEAERSSDDEG